MWQSSVLERKRGWVGYKYKRTMIDRGDSYIRDVCNEWDGYGD
jgi:hypothetical protein